MSGKHRRKGVKREHGCVPGLVPELEALAAEPAVDSVIPGVIRVGRSQAIGFSVRLQAPTISGFKLVARTGKLVQEVFVTGTDRSALERLLRTRYGAGSALD